MEVLIQRVAAMIACGADESDVRAMLARETEDEGLAFLLLSAGRLLAKEPE